jgi:Family of unknown function (DUF6416)
MLTEVPVKIPEERVGEFYELVGRWLAGAQLEVVEAPDAPATSPTGWTQSDSDLAFARVVWEKFSPRAQAVFSLLMDQAGRKVSAEELATTLDIPHGISGVAGVLAWPARHCAAVNKTVPWRWEEGPEGGSGARYWAEVKVAAVFKKVRS